MASVYGALARRFDRADSDATAYTRLLILDIGGEGRHPEAWNLNPRTKQTLAPRLGEPIARLIRARGERIPLAAESVDLVIVERTPLRPATLSEIRRVAKPGSLVLLRHADLPGLDPHRVALRMLPGSVRRCVLQIGRRTCRETLIRLKAGKQHNDLTEPLSTRLENAMSIESAPAQADTPESKGSRQAGQGEHHAHA